MQLKPNAGLKFTVEAKDCCRCEGLNGRLTQTAVGATALKATVEAEVSAARLLC